LRLEDLVGQERTVSVLRNALCRERVAHAYLFTGPESVGKSTAAALFAQALNCEDTGHGLPCGACRSCRLTSGGRHPDVRVVGIGSDAEGRRRTEISIDQIRQNPRKPRQAPLPLIQDAYLKPAIGRHKVYVISPADRLTAEAGNALLKLLEEPPPHVVLLLVTSEPSTLLPTVVSRCQEVVFQLAGSGAIENHLIGLGLSEAAAASLARLSGGRIAWAIRAAERPEVLRVRDALLNLCAAIGERSVPESLRLAEDIKWQAAELARARISHGGEELAVEAGSDPQEEHAVGDRELREELPWCLDIMVSWYRDLLAGGQDAPLLNPDYEQALTRQYRPHFTARAECAVESILEAKHALQRNANIDIALESLTLSLVAWCG
jgi:DNA polymerase-3 subunit delta'